MNYGRSDERPGSRRSPHVDIDQRRRRQPFEYVLMANLIYRCPRTAMNVQIWLAEEVSADQH
jgi:hypothetical protein